MGWYGRENITKYYSIGFTEENLQEINAYKGSKPEYKKAYFKKHSNFIRHLALSCIDLEKENVRLKNILANLSKDGAAAGGQGKEITAWTGNFRNVKRIGNVIYPVWG